MTCTTGIKQSNARLNILHYLPLQGETKRVTFNAKYPNFDNEYYFVFCMIITFPSQEKVLLHDYYCYCNHILNNHSFSTKLLYIIYVILNISLTKDTPWQYITPKRYCDQDLDPGLGMRWSNYNLVYQQYIYKILYNK